MGIVNGTWLSNSIRTELEKNIDELQKAQKNRLSITFDSSFVPADNYREEWIFIKQGGLLAWLFKKVFVRIQCGIAKNERLITIYWSLGSTLYLIQKVRQLMKDFASVHPGFSVRVEMDQK